MIPSMSMVHGGPSRAVRAMEAALPPFGVHCEIASTNDDGANRRTHQSLGMPLAESTTGQSTRWYFYKNLDFYKCSWSLAAWLRRSARNYDLIHIHALFSFSTIAAAWAARRAGVPYVVRPLGTLSQYSLRRRRPWLKRLSLYFLEGPLLARAAAVHFTSESEMIEAQTLGIPMRCSVIPLGLRFPPAVTEDVANREFPSLTSTLYFLSLSRIDPKKNIDGLIDAFALVADEYPHAFLVIAGDGGCAYLRTLKQRAVEGGHADRIVWLGNVDGERKQALLQRARAFVLPSHSENFGIAVVEALGAGLPCLVSNQVAICEDVVAAGAGLVCTTAVTDIAAKMSQLLVDDLALQTMRDKAVNLAAERYSLEAMGRGLSALYNEITKKSATNVVS